MAKIKLMQVLCPARHLIAAMAFDAEENSEDETKSVMSASMTRNNINACVTCKTSDLRFETVETNFDTLAEAGHSIVDNNDVSFIEMLKKVEFHEPVRTSAENKCVRCRKSLDAATGIQKRAPAGGDVSVCLYCGQFMIFRADLTLRAPDAAELANLKATLRANQPEVLRLVEQAVRNFIAGRARREN